MSGLVRFMRDYDNMIYCESMSRFSILGNKANQFTHFFTYDRRNF
ncbi:hypothetical protein VAE130_570662 [Vibrio aestuarianus]|uniref:Uncharacterized protein n=1 Tax=Vibrio aestuarianus TaxID=28171 RepID=A0ABN8TS24_9VIBR|nr:hypothetical protein VAE308_1050665 [Vibrio aestuarianus]CAH8199231.1 hypothetical protein VIBAE_A31257 [Vibrio aestuarianus subsp. francensis]CAH8199698.1 hypothetical protein VAE055_380018 [Vibrio aestuarianus]CAH8199769.1 hypothetical protein VAE032_270660 [Vibrio aestuarianus]CAH8199908.1 hypothetical protein VAE128_460664 [Vibrio aestuarianus]